jgi:hypothetical protein
MNRDQFFTQIDSADLSYLIDNAQESVILAMPGIQAEVATSLMKASHRLGKEMVIVCLDVNEQAMRLGYGDIQAVELLRENNIVIQHIDHLRFALIIADSEGYSFSPTALYLESEATSTLGFNAIKLTAEQVKEAMVRLSPAAKAIAVISCNDDGERKKLEKLIPCIPNNPIDDNAIKSISKSLTETPPVEFDVSRQVRVYNAYLQYVEVHMTGAAIQRQKIAMPRKLEAIATADTDLEGRFKTSFDLLAKDNQLSSKALEKELKSIRDQFTASLGKDKGRVILHRNKDRFITKMAKLVERLEEHSLNVKDKLQESINDSKNAIAKIYVPALKENLTEDITIIVGNPPTEATLHNFVLDELHTVFPSADAIIKKMEIRYEFKDLTYETLNNKEFLDNVKKAFKYESWDKAHSEYLAASESE